MVEIDDSRERIHQLKALVRVLRMLIVESQTMFGIEGLVQCNVMVACTFD